MKLREEEFYEQYHQHGGTTIIPTEIFNELYDDATEEIERLNNIINGLDNTIENLEEVIKCKDNIIKEVREYIEENRVKATKYFNAFDGSLCMDKKYVDKLLEILDKGE